MNADVLLSVSPIETADQVLVERQDWINQRLSRKKKAAFASQCVPFLLCGPARSGKDFGATYLQDNYLCSYAGSLSTFLVGLLAVQFNIPYGELHKVRHHHRMFLYQFANRLRESDPSLLVRLGLAGEDFVVGTRAKVEMDAALSLKLVETSIWVENPNVDHDPTIEFTKEDCHLVIYNDSSKGQEPYIKRLQGLASLLRLTPRFTK